MNGHMFEGLIMYITYSFIYVDTKE